MQSRKLFIGASCLAVAGLLFLSCAPATAPTPTAKPTAASSKAETPAAKPAATSAAAPSPTPKPAAGQPKYGGILTLAHAAEPATFDIHQESGGQHPVYLLPAFNGLLQYDPLAWPEPKIIPDLTSSWEISPNGMEYTFRLKNGVKWHDGKPFTSEDVKASLDRTWDPPKGIRSPRKGSFHAVTEVQAAAPDLVKVRLKYPSASLASILASDWLVIMPKHIIEAKGDMRRDVIGTGPFKFKEYVVGGSFQYVKNADYFVKGRPYLEGITIYPVKDGATRFAALRAGRVLYLPYPYGVTPTQAKVAKEDPNMVLQSNWRPSLSYLRFNLNRSPWGDPRVRRAMSLAIDRQAVILAAMEGAGMLGAQMPSAGPWGIPEDELLKMPGYRQPKDADIAEARKLLAEAGFASGFQTSILTRVEPEHSKRGTVVQAELAKLGIKADHVVKEIAAFDDSLVRRAFDTEVHSAATAIDDPDMRFGDFYVTGGGRNYGEYNNPKFDELYLKQSRALDVSERKKIIREMLNILFEETPDVALAWGISTVAHHKRMKNWKIAASPYINNAHQETWLAD